MTEQMSPQVVAALLRRERLSLVGRLLRGLVHNLSGGLQMMRLPLDLIEMKLAQGASAQDVANKLDSLQEGVSRVQDEIAVLAARSQQQASDQAAELDPAQVAADQLALWRGDMFFKHQVSLHPQPTAGLGLVRAAYADLALAFNLLLANSLEAMQNTEEPSLGLICRVEGGEYLLLVADNGPGPAPGLAGRALEPFVGDKNGEHDGLGLFLAGKALEPWGGGVFWDADAGAFGLSLPLADDRAA